MFGSGGCFLWGFDQVGEFRDGMIDDDLVAGFGMGLSRADGAVDCLGRGSRSHEDVDVFGLGCGWGCIESRENTALFASKFGLALVE